MEWCGCLHSIQPELPQSRVYLPCQVCHAKSGKLVAETVKAYAVIRKVSGKERSENVKTDDKDTASTSCPYT